ncbi:branched-chain amino acid ABC transporter permease [Nisaea acidiphila]|uniref:Branched-chain amino acid ABC transporter permease n=1 Tax=Nisaea acidiphila TaxID=1862145 RepID=A0A9J7AMN8_9PROT|nr:branched-chain amino acid ABC transporter permease [Nisaea acidiphila]UUX48218.1 branched-chain amino acid ABC transporter permease [Nisaea acidiphila]
MSPRKLDLSIYGALIAAGILVPLLAPAFTSQMAVLWLMVLMAVTWDMTGGQMGYNSLGNITFFGIGMYASAVVQIGLVYDVAEYTSAFGAIKVDFTEDQYWTGLFLGIGFGGVMATIFAMIVGPFMLGLRGPYFAIGTLGLAVAVAEMVSGWRYVGGGSGISMPVFPGAAGTGSLVFYILLFALAILSHLVVRAVLKTRFGLAINAIRDDEDKAEAMGIHTTRYKVIAWMIPAFFMGMAGAVFGNMSGFIEPLEVAFPTATFGIFMVAMALLGGKGTIWGPVLGAILFHIIKEVTWTHLLGWQWVALGAIIIINIVYFQQGILGWAQDRWPALFGLTVDERMTRTGQAEAAE